MIDLFIALVAMLPLLLVMTLGGGPASAADPAEERARRSLRIALRYLISSGVPKRRVSQLAARELVLITRGAK